MAEENAVKDNAPAKVAEAKPVEKKAEVKRPVEQQAPEAKKAEEAKPAEKPVPAKPAKKHNILLFNKWDISGVKVTDRGLANYVNIKPIIVPRTGGRYTTNPIHRNKIPLVERLINKLMVPGHRGKKHKITSGRCSGSTQAIYFSVKKAFERIEEKTKKNPMQVLVDAIQNAALLEEVAGYRMGGMIARKAVTVSPQRRYDLALRYLTQGIYKTAFRSKRPLANVIADELMAAAANDPKNHAIQERLRIEKEAEGSR